MKKSLLPNRGRSPQEGRTYVPKRVHSPIPRVRLSARKLQASRPRCRRGTYRPATFGRWLTSSRLQRCPAKSRPCGTPTAYPPARQGRVARTQAPPATRAKVSLLLRRQAAANQCRATGSSCSTPGKRASCLRRRLRGHGRRLQTYPLCPGRNASTPSGPAGLLDRPKGGPKVQPLARKGSPSRTILMLKQANPDWGCQKISDMLTRGPAAALPAAANAVASCTEAGYELRDAPHSSPPRQGPPLRTRPKPTRLWQTDLFTFVLKRQNRRVHLVAFMDDHSRFIVGLCYGLHASQSTALVMEVVRALCHPPPTARLKRSSPTTARPVRPPGRGTSVFNKELTKRGIRQIVQPGRAASANARQDRTVLGHRALAPVASWPAAVFLDLGDAHGAALACSSTITNFQRPHQGIDGLVPADRFFGTASEVLRTFPQAAWRPTPWNWRRHGRPSNPFYLTGQMGGQPFSVHAEGERVIRSGGGGGLVVDLVPRAPAETDTPWPEPVGPAGVVQTPEGWVDQP